jgi:hypothetical protein
MTKKEKFSLKLFLIELGIYAALVIGYALMVLHFLSHWLKALFDRSKPEYAVIALLLIVAQGVVLEAFSAALTRLFEPKTK